MLLIWFMLSKMLVSREFTFDAAHFLTNYRGKCERLHGHTYKLQVTVEGHVRSDGLVIDFVLLKKIVKKRILDRLDHFLLNDIIKNPSAERIIVWIWKELNKTGFNKSVRLYELKLWETPTAFVTYSGTD